MGREGAAVAANLVKWLRLFMFSTEDTVAADILQLCKNLPMLTVVSC